jgi:hypothetical protein
MPIPHNLLVLVLCLHVRNRARRRRRNLLLQLLIVRYRRLAKKRRHPGRLGSPPGRPWKKPRMNGVESRSLLTFLLQQPDPKQFLRNFRVDLPMFNFLVDKLTLQLAVHPGSFRRDEVFPRESVAMALYALGSPAEFRSIAHIARRGETTVSKHMYRFCKAVVAKWGQQSANPVIRHATNLFIIVFILPFVLILRLAFLVPFILIFGLLLTSFYASVCSPLHPSIHLDTRHATGLENVVIADEFMSQRGLPGCIGGYDGKHWFARAGPSTHPSNHLCTYPSIHPSLDPFIVFCVPLFTLIYPLLFTLPVYSSTQSPIHVCSTIHSLIHIVRRCG